MRPEPITTQHLLQLQRALALAEVTIESAAASSSRTDRIPFELLIARFDHVKIQMYCERGGQHKRPHFHIEYKRQYRASYAIDTLERIKGYMPKPYERPVLKWARSVQPQLTTCWERLSRDGTPLDLQAGPPPASQPTSR